MPNQNMTKPKFSKNSGLELQLPNLVLRTPGHYNELRVVDILSLRETSVEVVHSFNIRAFCTPFKAMVSLREVGLL